MTSADYLRLDSEKIAHTVEQLHSRISERFPHAGLTKVSREVLHTAQEAQSRTEWISRPLVAVRGAVGAIIFIMLAGLYYTVQEVKLPAKSLSFPEVVQVCESGVNNIILIGAAFLFLVTLETRIKRRRALTLIHELRVLAHVIDMHQLPKDPAKVVSLYSATPSSIRVDLSAFQLNRYLNFCSELLSAIGKIAASYVQRFNDPVVVSAVNDIEDLTTGLSAKIWQKIMILRNNSASA